MKRVFTLLLMLSALGLVISHIAHADSYNVSAVVPYSIPSVPATIDSSLAGISLTEKNLRIFGTCEQSNPANVVIFMRQTQVVGSVSCSASGTYQLDIDLTSGVNTFIARTANLNGVYGPDSQSDNVTYTPPVNNPTTAQREDASSDLTIATEQPFITLAAGQKSVTVVVIVAGGQNPYVIELNWGDGSLEQKKVDSPGTYTFTHEYLKSASYQVKAIVTDVLGVSRIQYFAIASASPNKQQSSETKNNSVGVVTSCTTWGCKWWNWVLLVLFFLFGLLIGAILMKRRLDRINGSKK